MSNCPISSLYDGSLVITIISASIFLDFRKVSTFATMRLLISRTIATCFLDKVNASGFDLAGYRPFGFFFAEVTSTESDFAPFWIK